MEKGAQTHADLGFFALHHFIQQASSSERYEQSQALLLSTMRARIWEEGRRGWVECDDMWEEDAAEGSRRSNTLRSELTFGIVALLFGESAGCGMMESGRAMRGFGGIGK